MNSSIIFTKILVEQDEILCTQYKRILPMLREMESLQGILERNFIGNPIFPPLNTYRPSFFVQNHFTLRCMEHHGAAMNPFAF